MTKLYLRSLPNSITEESLLQLFTEKGYTTRRVRKNPAAVGAIPATGEDFLAGVLAVAHETLLAKQSPRSQLHCAFPAAGAPAAGICLYGSKA